MERVDQLLIRPERAEGAASRKISQALRDSAIQICFRRQRDPARFHFGLS
jgi:hypothetical protein